MRWPRVLSSAHAGFVPRRKWERLPAGFPHDKSLFPPIIFKYRVKNTDQVDKSIYIKVI